MKHFSEAYLDGRCRTESLKRLTPKLFTQEYKTVLYIGATIGRCDYLNNFRSANYEITVLEVFGPNAEHYRKIPWIKNVLNGDVCSIDILEKSDVTFWWHGPEHIPQSNLVPTLKKLESQTNKLIVLGCPWGEYPLDPQNENPHEKHLSFYDYATFESMGYVVECIGKKDVPGSNITSVKFLK